MENLYNERFLTRVILEVCTIGDFCQDYFLVKQFVQRLLSLEENEKNKLIDNLNSIKFTKNETVFILILQEKEVDEYERLQNAKRYSGKDLEYLNTKQEYDLVQFLKKQDKRASTNIQKKIGKVLSENPITNKIIEEFKSKFRCRRLQLAVEGKPLIRPLLDDCWEKENIDKALTTLTKLEYVIINLRFGLEDGQRIALEDLSHIIDRTPERLRQIEAKALRKLRHPERKFLMSRDLSKFKEECRKHVDLLGRLHREDRELEYCLSALENGPSNEEIDENKIAEYKDELKRILKIKQEYMQKKQEEEDEDNLGLDDDDIFDV